MAISKAIRALACIPAAARSPEVQQVIEQGTAWFLKHRVHTRSHDPVKVAKPGWLRFGFPLMYQSDSLEILDVLTGLGCRDARLQDAMDTVLAARGPDGRWILRNSYDDRFLVPLGEKGQPSRWVTLRALRVLKRWYPEA